MNLPDYVEEYHDLPVIHPRYLALPDVFWQIRWIPYYLVLERLWSSKDIRTDILLIEWIYPDAYAALRYARKYKIKAVGVTHGNEAIGYLENPTRRKKYIDALRSFDGIISVSNDLKNKMIEEYSIPDYKITVIPNGIDPNKFIFIDRLRARDELGLHPKRPMSVCVARLSPEKNLDVLIEAASRMNTGCPDIYIIGDGPEKSKLEFLIRKLNMSKRVRLVGPIKHELIYKWLNAADFFCLPSQREGCPVVIHEALACGIPVVATTVGAIPDIICSADYGLLCPPSDVEALAFILRKALSLSWDRKKIASYGCGFTWDDVALKTLDVLRRISD